jgi:hypothetical protein
MTLLDYRRDLASTAKAAGTAAARRGDPELYAAPLGAIERRATTGAAFSADDNPGDHAGASGPAIGSPIRTASERGLIRMYGVTGSRSLSRHGALIRLWQGVPSR